VYDREEWKRLMRTARNHRILYMPMDWLIDWLIDYYRLNTTILSNTYRIFRLHVSAIMAIVRLDTISEENCTILYYVVLFPLVLHSTWRWQKWPKHVVEIFYMYPTL
jgi:hypothetical protein